MVSGHSLTYNVNMLPHVRVSFFSVYVGESLICIFVTLNISPALDALGRPIVIS